VVVEKTYKFIGRAGEPEGLPETKKKGRKIGSGKKEPIQGEGNGGGEGGQKNGKGEFIREKNRAKKVVPLKIGRGSRKEVK